MSYRVPTVTITYPEFLFLRVRIVRYNGKIIHSPSWDIDSNFYRLWLKQAKKRLSRFFSVWGRGGLVLVLDISQCLVDSRVSEYEDEEEEK